MIGGILGKKQGMTRIVNSQRVLVPVTVVKILENEVLELRAADKHGKNAIVVGMDPYHKAAKNRKFKNIKAFAVEDLGKYSKGQKISADLLQDVKLVTISMVSKGKGFQGVMKRYGFHGGPGSHGSHFHREPGSIGQRALPGKVQKGKKLPGHMGQERITLRNRPVEALDLKQGLLMVKGALPGSRNTLVEVKF